MDSNPKDEGGAPADGRGAAPTNAGGTADSIILEEEIDPNYEPTHDEVRATPRRAPALAA